MAETNYPGIDYGMGTSNRDKKTGIRYGVIPLGDLAHWVLEEFKEDFGEPSCPDCGSGMVDSSQAPETDEDNPDVEVEDLRGDKDYFCQHCWKTFWADRCFSEEPVATTYDKDGLLLQIDSNNDVWVLESPYYTRAQFCSPCAPGAVYLTNYCLHGAHGYCLPPDWFEDSKAPYPVYKVGDNTLVEPKTK